MSIQVSYTSARASLAKLCDEVTNNNEVVVITRRGARDVALVSKAELFSLIETAHLFRSPKNAARILAAYNRAKKNTGRPQSPDTLREGLGID
jgi:antitoxin YefM